VLISWTSIHERVKEFFILLLIMETRCRGIHFPDLFLFISSGSDADTMALLIGILATSAKFMPRLSFLCTP